jgi:hypothetical protein
MGRGRFLGVKVGGIAKILNPIATVIGAVVLTPVMGPVLATAVSSATVTATSGGHSGDILKSAVIGGISGGVATGVGACTTVTQKMVFASVSGASIASMTDQNPVKGAIISGISAGLCPTNPIAGALLVAVVQKDINAGLKVMANHYTQALIEYYNNKIIPTINKSREIRQSGNFDFAENVLNDLKQNKQVIKNLSESNYKQLENNNLLYKDNLRFNNELTLELLSLPKRFNDPNLTFRTKLLNELTHLMNRRMEICCTFIPAGQTAHPDISILGNSYVNKIKEINEYDINNGIFFSNASENQFVMSSLEQCVHNMDNLESEAIIMIDTDRVTSEALDRVRTEYRKLNKAQVRDEIQKVLKVHHEVRYSDVYQNHSYVNTSGSVSLGSSASISDSHKLTIDTKGNLGIQTDKTGVKIGKSDIYPRGISIAYTHRNNINDTKKIQTETPIAFEQSTGVCISSRDTLSGRNEGYVYATHETHINNDCVIAGGVATLGAVLLPEITIPVTIVSKVLY